jgi:GxxExxY protein
MSRDADRINAITETIIGGGFKVLNTLGTGFLEKVYENALAHELRKRGIDVAQQQPVQVHYDDVVVGDYLADLLVEGHIIIELKATREHYDVYTAQCLNYLMATGMSVCLLLNFGKPQLDIKRYAHPGFAN